MKVAVRYFTEFGSSVSTMESSELASWIKRYNFKISSITEVDEEESKVSKKEITHEEIFNDDKKAKLKEFIDKFKGQELFKKSNDRAREILASIKWLPKVCNDCNTALESCTCIEDTLEIEDVELEEDEFCYYSGLPSPKAYEEETKCYCGHTTTCDCGPKDTEDENNDETLRKQFPANIEGSTEFNEMCKEDFNLTKVDIIELMRRAYNAGYNQYNIVEAGLEGKDTEENVRWILTKYETEKLENSKRKRNFYCGDKVDYDEQCLEQCDRCVDCTGVDYGYYDENQ